MLGELAPVCTIKTRKSRFSLSTHRFREYIKSVLFIIYYPNLTFSRPTTFKMALQNSLTIVDFGKAHFGQKQTW